MCSNCLDVPGAEGPSWRPRVNMGQRALHGVPTQMCHVLIAWGADFLDVGMVALTLRDVTWHNGVQDEGREAPDSIACMGQAVCLSGKQCGQSRRTEWRREGL